jgi:hypothetical protein
MSMDDDKQARDRLIAYTGVRIGGLAVFFLGIAIIYTNLVRPGGWPQVGAIIAILGVIDAMFAPRILKRAWDQQDAAAAARADDPGADQPEQ